MSDNGAEAEVIELGQHEPTAESVVTRLHRHMDRIRSITAIVQWDDGSYDVCCDAKPIEQLCFDRLVLDKSLMEHVGPRDDD